jgi:hypothetical protein
MLSWCLWLRGWAFRAGMRADGFSPGEHRGDKSGRGFRAVIVANRVWLRAKLVTNCFVGCNTADILETLVEDAVVLLSDSYGVRSGSSLHKFVCKVDRNDVAPRDVVEGVCDDIYLLAVLPYLRKRVVRSGRGGAVWFIVLLDAQAGWVVWIEVDAISCDGCNLAKYCMGAIEV